jgi:hypothetical protein
MLKLQTRENTYISAKTYPRIEKYMKARLVELNNELIRVFEISKDRKINESHVDRAISNLMIGEEE